MEETQDVALRSLERRGEWSWLAFAYRRAGNTWAAYEAAVRAAEQESSDTARDLIVPTDLALRAPWRGLRELSGVRVIATRFEPVNAVDLGGARLVVEDGLRMAAFDLIAGSFLWERCGVPLAAFDGRLVALAGNDVLLVEATTGIVVRRWSKRIESAPPPENEPLFHWWTRSQGAVHGTKLVVRVTCVRAIGFGGWSCSTFAPALHRVSILDLVTGIVEGAHEIDEAPWCERYQESTEVGTADTEVRAVSTRGVVQRLTTHVRSTGQELARFDLRRFNVSAYRRPLFVAGRIVLRGRRGLVVIEEKVPSALRVAKSKAD